MSRSERGAEIWGSVLLAAMMGSFQYREVDGGFYELSQRSRDGRWMGVAEKQRSLLSDLKKKCHRAAV